jgi:hypothetical protein
MTDITFFGGIKVASARLTLSEPQETNRLADGSILKASLGAALWQGELSLIPGYHVDQGAIEVRLAKLLRAGQTFLAYDTRYDGPASDPDGIILGSNTPTIHTLNGDNRRLRVTGLPAGYQLTAGDWIGWTYGSNPVRYALHRIETDATASSAGLTPLFAVEPFIRPGITVGAAVTLVRPPIKAVMTQADYGAARPVITDGASFSFIQTLR